MATLPIVNTVLTLNSHRTVYIICNGTILGDRSSDSQWPKEKVGHLPTKKLQKLTLVVINMQETVISLTSLFWVILQSYNVYEAFSKSGTQSVSGQPQEGVNSLVNTSIDVLVHSLVDRIDMLESSIKERKRHRSST